MAYDTESYDEKNVGPERPQAGTKGRIIEEQNISPQFCSKYNNHFLRAVVT